MEDLTKYTPTELLKKINDCKDSHDALKTVIAQATKTIDELSAVINDDLDKLTGLEKDYVALVEELNNR